MDITRKQMISTFVGAAMALGATVSTAQAQEIVMKYSDDIADIADLGIHEYVESSEPVNFSYQGGYPKAGCGEVVIGDKTIVFGEDDVYDGNLSLSIQNLLDGKETREEFTPGCPT